MVRRAAKTDDNQAEIVAALRACGYSVLSLAAVGQGCPDLLVGHPTGNILIEVKDGSKSPSRRVLTDDQVEFFNAWRGPAYVAATVEQALEVMGRETI